MNDVIVNVKGVKTYFKQKKGMFSKQESVVKAVDNVDLEIHKGETLGLVG